MTWARATLAARCLGAGGRDLGGLWLRARPGPARDAFFAALPPHVRIHPAIEEDALFGGLDLTETLRLGRSVHHAGVLAGAPLIVLTGADRCPPALAARLGQHLDAGGAPVVAVDEGDGDERPPIALTERLGLFVHLDDIALSDVAAIPRDESPSTKPVRISPEAIAAITVTAATLGIPSLRAPCFALAAARVLACLGGRTCPTEDDLRDAVALTLAHRASPPPEDAAEPDRPSETAPPENTQTAEDGGTMGDRMVDAARAALPPGVLMALAAGRSRDATGSGAGAQRANALRGRPRPARAGPPSRGRIDTVATLRAAVPWQTIRRAARPEDPRPILIHPSDIRLRRFQQQTGRLVIFVLDASGSAAMARLAEAKGAIEHLLSDAYAARDHVAVIGFRGAQADCLLAPTGSLTRAKRALAGLPGGGGTPLASGLHMGLAMTRQAHRTDRAPSIVLLTDGRANIAADGMPDRKRALADAQEVCREIAEAGVPMLCVDTGMRPNPALQDLAKRANGRYLALPRAGSGALATAVRA